MSSFYLLSCRPQGITSSICSDLYYFSDTVSLGDILSFYSGANDIPPLGFPHEAELNFNPIAVYPTASTCAIQLTLPTKYRHFDEFKNRLDQPFTMHGGFGLL